jgi:hypothetical protein
MILLFIAPACVQADVIHSNFGPGDSFGTVNFAIRGASASPPLEEVHQAAPFTPTFDAQFDSAELPLGLFGGGTNLFIVELRNDDGFGLPGSVIESFTLDGVLTGPELIRTVNSTLHPTLNAGSQYWLTALPGADDAYATWRSNDQGEFGRASGPDWGYVNATRQAFRINGTPTAIPEPSSLALFGIGAVGVLGYGWRRRRT